jgi:hypothetical protein
MITASAHARRSAIKKRSAGYFPLITDPAEGVDPSATTPSIDETKLENSTRSGNPSLP